MGQTYWNVGTLPAYDIFKKQDGALVWAECAHDFETAKKRLAELAKQNHYEYLILDQRQQQVVSDSNASV